MSNKISVLQIGSTDWSKKYNIPENIAWNYIAPGNLENFVEDLQQQHEARVEKALEKEIERIQKLKQKSELSVIDEDAIRKKVRIKTFNLTLLDSIDSIDDINLLKKFCPVYTILYNNRELFPEKFSEFCRLKQPRDIDFSNPQNIIDMAPKSFFKGGGYGEKYSLEELSINRNFDGDIEYNGHAYIKLTGNFGDSYKQVVICSHNKPIYKNSPIELWPEYKKQGNVEIQMVVKTIVDGSLSTIDKEWIFSEEDLKDAVILDTDIKGYISVSIFVKGDGVLELGPIHYRFSRLGFGNFSLGGTIKRDSNRQELLFYFNPGDLKPPLNVYFSGWRAAEGFEGFNIMNGLNAPFLLISDPRLSGGSFYLGSEELESKVPEVVNSCLDYLGFTNKDLILSGISMGTFGASYYAPKLLPHAVIISKPVLGVGTVALREKLRRPDVFPTSLDILMTITGGQTENHTKILDNIFWDRFNSGNFDNTHFAVVYMKQEDYDDKSYSNLLKSLKNKKTHLNAKGLSGRHNDNFGGNIVAFMNFYKNILRRDFGRIDL
ncbi:accessory Sec system protein Asp2 [Gemella sp. GH3]|uniref:accessory Sec system protein Asp2 n=1 Tax=unclassified Gemella TaxID=2624949 RepID=UPI0015D09BAC|nr:MULTISPECIES: accessory Sec system protein Asp2 [unclassified Gemella]MBF0714050.1 accessory Sec system protein Asp2 [Gemella sp. GH3.1]NYS51002.1 accessory Sec system protein Asp2 [Gemella sp. GH3]